MHYHSGDGVYVEIVSQPLLSISVRVFSHSSIRGSHSASSRFLSEGIVLLLVDVIGVQFLVLS